MKKPTKIDTLAKLLFEGKGLTKKQLAKAVDVKEEGQIEVMIAGLRRGNNKRPPMNVQSVSINGNIFTRVYKLITKESSTPEEVTEILKKTQKTVSTMGKNTWKPNMYIIAKKIPTMQFKKLILSQQEAIIDSYLIENNSKEINKEKS